MSTFPWKKIEILVTSDISTTENGENDGAWPYTIFHYTREAPDEVYFICIRRTL